MSKRTVSVPLVWMPSTLRAAASASSSCVCSSIIFLDAVHMDAVHVACRRAGIEREGGTDIAISE